MRLMSYLTLCDPDVVQTSGYQLCGALIAFGRGGVMGSVSLRRCLVKDAGGIRSANADMSSDKEGEMPSRRKPKDSYATFIGIGLVDT